MILQNWWYTTLLHTKTEECPPLKKDVACDYFVVGGGMAGLHAALRFSATDKKVILIERNICGGSSTGKSAGFITPESELGLEEVERRYGKHSSYIYKMPVEGTNLIIDTVKKYKIKCDLVKQDSLFVGIGKNGAKKIEEEVEARKRFKLNYKFYGENEIKKENKGEGYSAGVSYTGTYGINPLLYSQELKNILLNKGVDIYESTELMEVNGNLAKTHLGKINAKKIIVCIDKMPPKISEISKQVYHAQTFLSITGPLSKQDIKGIFPNKEYMCWDDKLVYTYYRLTGDRRILLGGGSLLTTFSKNDVTTPRIIEGIIQEFKTRFPALEHLEFIQYWPGRIDTTKDLMPIVGHDPVHKDVQHILGNVGLPYAAWCGDYAARTVIKGKCEDYCDFLSPNRKFFIKPGMQKIMGKMASWTLNNAYTTYIQKDYD